MLQLETAGFSIGSVNARQGPNSADEIAAALRIHAKGNSAITAR
jgi:hypothetical protein